MKRIFIFLIGVIAIIGMGCPGWAESSTGSISGTVVNHSDNIQLEGIGVRLYQGTDENIADSSAWYWLAQTQTNENGDYQFSGLDQRRYRIHIYDQEISGTYYVGTDIYNVQVFESVNTPDINFILRQAGLIYGHVKSADGTPIPNAELITNCAWIQGGNDTHSAQTDSNGRYEF